jgi:hypothetical protein
VLLEKQTNVLLMEVDIDALNLAVKMGQMASQIVDALHTEEVDVVQNLNVQTVQLGQLTNVFHMEEVSVVLKPVVKKEHRVNLTDAENMVAAEGVRYV